MPTPSPYDYAVIRVVPHVERGEFVNVGVVLFCRTRRYLAAAIELDEVRLQILAPDLEIKALRQHLDLIPAICRGNGPIGQLGQTDCFHWITAPHSTVIQTSPVHSGICTDPAAELERLLDVMVRSQSGPPVKQSHC